MWGGAWVGKRAVVVVSGARKREDAGWCWEKGDAGRRAVDLMGSVGEVGDAG